MIPFGNVSFHLQPNGVLLVETSRKMFQNFLEYGSESDLLSMTFLRLSLNETTIKFDKEIAKRSPMIPAVRAILIHTYTTCGDIQRLEIPTFS